MSQIEWKQITGTGGKTIGAVGFLDDQVVVIVSYYNDADGNMDGRVSFGERIAAMISPIRLKGYGVLNVAMQASIDLDVVSRDGNFGNQANQLFMNFATRAVADGFYTAYFAMAVNQSAGAFATALRGNSVQQFMIKKGMEAAVKKAFQDATP